MKLKASYLIKVSTLIGPNYPGISLRQMKLKLVLCQGFLFMERRVGVVSRSGTLTYEAVDQLIKVGLGQFVLV